MNYSSIQTGRVIILAVIFCFSTNAFSAGRAGFPVAKTLMNARSLALGGACVSIQGWGSGANLNPASAVGITNDVSVSYANHTLDLWSGLIFMSAEITPNLTSGIFLSTFDYGEFDVSESGPGPTGETFSAGEYILSGFVARKMTSDIDLGISAKYLWGSIQDESASAMALDIGVIWITGWENINIALVGRNIGVQFNSYGSEDGIMPTELLIGGSRKIEHLPLTIYSVLTASKTGEEDWTADFLPGSPGIGFGVGGEFAVSSDGKSVPMMIRMGYRSRGQGLQMGHPLDVIAGFTFGFGFNIKNFNVDYTYAPMGALGDLHRFSLETNILNRLL